MTMPVVAIVGRPNVGKSSLLNALIGKRISIVQDMPGVTRDRISVPMQLDGKYIELVDTGGYGFIDPDKLTEHIKHQIELAMQRADVIVFIVDSQTGLTAGDQEIAALLRKLNLKVILVANKADKEKADVVLGDFSRLGLGTPIGVSATTGRNIEHLINLLAKEIDLTSAPVEIPEPEMLMAIVGKRNAGKSTLVNAIAGLYEGDTDRVIVSEIPGTTRDSVDVRFEKDGKSLIVIDTAGVRKKRHMVTNDIEFYSFHRAERSIRRADVVVMLLDSTEKVSEPDKKLAAYIAEQMKPVVIAINKWDIARAEFSEMAKAAGDRFDETAAMEQYRTYLDQELKHLDYAPLVFVTAKEGKNVQSVVDMAQNLFKQASERVGTGRLNTAIRQVFEERFPSTPTGRRARIYYATQTETNPPTIVLFVNKPDFINETYQRFMINRLRKLLPYQQVPIKLVLRGKEARSAEKEAKDFAGKPVDQGLTEKPAKKAGGKRRK